MSVGELGLKEGTPGRPVWFGIGTSHVEDALQQCFRSPRVNGAPGDVVSNHFRPGIEGSGENGAPDPHCFQVDETESFTARRECERYAMPEVSVALGVIHQA